VGYFSQFSLDILKPQNTVMEEVRSHLPTANDGFLRNLLACFLFRGDDVDKKVSVLSGGEKSRLILATLLTKQHNVLILDEPTNHLDLKSRDVLTDALINFEGTLIMVSHDRHFLKKIANRVMLVAKNQVQLYPGTYTEYLQAGVSSAR
jgi:ATP-binding cassette subfamily F protein 3